jgi:hypothetical protein
MPVVAILSVPTYRSNMEVAMGRATEAENTSVKEAGTKDKHPMRSLL